MATCNFITLSITTNASKLRSEKRYPIDITLGQLKEKLVLVTGCDNRTMKIELFDKQEKSLGYLLGDGKSLYDLGVENEMHIHVTDSTIADGVYDQPEEPVETYQLTDEEYAKREESVLAWKRRNKLGQFREVDPEEAKRAEELRQEAELKEKEKAESLSIGSRCEVRIPSQITKRGVIEFVGQTKFKPGYWVGIRYDEPLGRNDGSIEGVRYFQCPDKYGAFVKPQYVEAGDFPELGIDDLDEI
uniref:CAP-Gly domain-containing protein n=1 Tax=Trichobilharzia regenti TaxID=157069 RepID=A0AA85JL41_TRIRE|nr:unnamed protein product [Trichobilharzia regenti]